MDKHSTLDPRTVARALGGEVHSGGNVIAPGPGHSARDRSLSITLASDAPDGFVVNSFAGDEPIRCRDYVRERLGLPQWEPSKKAEAFRPANGTTKPSASSPSSGILADLPEASERNRNGRRPRFVAGAFPRQDDEIRRHTYRRAGTPVRIKLKTERGWLNWYAVRKGDVAGWQNCKPEGYTPTPYIGGLDPFDPAVSDDAVCWPEGEKDVEALARLGLPALTFGGAQDVRSEYAEILKGRHVVVFGDNDEPGRQCVARKVEELRKVAASLRVVDLSDVLSPGEDVADWIAAGATLDDVQARIDQAQTVEVEAKPGISATPFTWIDPASIPPREWIYGRHYVRRFVTTTVAPGGVGKSMLSIAEALAIATGKPLLGVSPDERANVWIWNGEDPIDELNRRVMATAQRYQLTRQDVEGRLFIDSGRAKPIIIADETRTGTVIAEPVVNSLIATIKANKIGVLIVDPFVSSHRVSENDNNKIDAVAKTWARIAEETNCAIELIHHVRKTGGNEITVEDGRGAVALLGAARSARALNPMTKEEAERFGIDFPRGYFRSGNGKANLAPPPEKSDWYRLVSEELGNANQDRPSDFVGVVVPWQVPDITAGVTTEHLEAVRNNLEIKPMRKDAQASDWAGYMVAKVIGADINTTAGKATVKKCLDMWVQSGAIAVRNEKDEHRRPRPFYVKGAFNDE